MERWRRFMNPYMTKALLRGQQIVEQDLRAARGTYDLDEVAALLGISRRAVAGRVRDDSLLAVPGPGKQRRYPAIQFTASGVPEGLRDVLKALPSRDPWYRLNWLVNPEPRLGGRQPFELLLHGEAEAVVEAAQRVGEMGS